MQTSSQAPADPGAEDSTNRRRIGIDYVVTAFTRWWTIEVGGTVDQAAVIEELEPPP